MQRTRLAVSAAAVALALTCVSQHDRQPPNTEEPQPSVYAETRLLASAWTDGDWPLTADSGILSCEGTPAQPYVFFTTPDGIMWPMNRLARALAGVRYVTSPERYQRDLTPLRRMVPSRESPGVSIRVPLDGLLRQGTALCVAEP